MPVNLIIFGDQRSHKLDRLDGLLNKVDEARDEVTELLQELVRIQTVNTGTMPTGNETELCRFLKRSLMPKGSSLRLLGMNQQEGILSPD